MITTIYYFSGTGNSFKVAKDLNSLLVDSKLVKISKKNLALTQDVLSQKIGIVYPIYYGGIPAMVKKFLENLQVHKDAYIFTVATLGGSDEISFNQIDDILRKKGSHISASFKINMPGSYQILYDVFSKEKQANLFKNENEQILKISASINENEIDNSSGKVKGIKKVICELIYSALKPSAKDKNFWVTEKCNGCGTCSKVCPARNIAMLNGKPQWKHQCEACMACMQWCPQKSIQYKKNTLKRGRYHHPEVKSSELFQDN